MPRVPVPLYDEWVPDTGSEWTAIRSAFATAHHGADLALTDMVHNYERRARDNWTLPNVVLDILGQPLNADHAPGTLPWPGAVTYSDLITNPDVGPAVPGPVLQDYIDLYKQVMHNPGGPAGSDFRHVLQRFWVEGWTWEKQKLDMQGLPHDHIPLLAQPSGDVVVEPGTGVERPTKVEIDRGRLKVNGKFPGLHAISEFDLLELLLRNNVTEVRARLKRARGGARNAVRVFNMYRGGLGGFCPADFSRKVYEQAMDDLIELSGDYGVFPEWTLLCDLEKRSDGSGGIMPGWQERSEFVIWMGGFLKGKPSIVGVMNEPFKNGASGASDPKLLALGKLFNTHAGGTVPYGVGDAFDDGSEAGDPMFAEQEAVARAGSNILMLHDARKIDLDEWSRPVNHVKGFADIRPQRKPVGDPLLYHREAIGFATTYMKAKRENNPEVAIAMAAVAAVTQTGFCYHHTTGIPGVPGLDQLGPVLEILQSPDMKFYNATTAGAPVQRVNWGHIPNGKVRTCSNGRDSFAVAYGGSPDGKTGILIDPNTLEWDRGSRTRVLHESKHVYIAHRS